MKKLIFAAIAIVSFASCVKNEVKVVDENAPISFQAVVGTPVKALIPDTSPNDYPETMTFGSLAYNHTAENFADADDVESLIPMSEVVYGTYLTGKWTTAQAYYWPADTKTNVTFWSFSPWSLKEAGLTFDTTAGFSLAEWDVDGNQDVDVMFADAVSTNKESSGANGVVTKFRHKLAKIAGFEFKTAADYTSSATFTLNEIKINDIYTKGTYTVAPTVGELANPATATTEDKIAALGKWTPSATDSKKSYTWYTGTGETVSPDGSTETSVTGSVNGNSYLLVLPQTFDANSAASIYIKYTVSLTGDQQPYEVEATKYLKDILTEDKTAARSWDINKSITYKITLSETKDRIIWDPEVVNWEDEDVLIEF